MYHFFTCCINGFNEDKNSNQVSHYATYFRKDSSIFLFKQQNQELEQKLAAIIEERSATIADLEGRLRKSEEKTKSLEEAVMKEKETFKSFRQESEIKCKNQQTLEEERAKMDRTENTDLKEKVDFLINLTSSYIQGLYEQCMEQEHILTLEDALPNNISKSTKARSSHILDPLKLIEDKLSQKVESIHLNWEKLLEDESHRRVIFGNLNNRVQMNLGRIDMLIKRLHGKYGNDLKREEERHAKKLNDLKKLHSEKISHFESQMKKKVAELRNLSLHYSDTRNQLKASLDSGKSLTEQNSNYKRIIQDHKRSLSEAKDSTAKADLEIFKVRSNVFNDKGCHSVISS